MNRNSTPSNNFLAAGASSGFVVDENSRRNSFDTSSSNEIEVLPHIKSAPQNKSKKEIEKRKNFQRKKVFTST